MLISTLKRSFATLAVVGGTLATAGPAGALTYNGHAGLGSSVYQHNQLDLEFLAFSPHGQGRDGFWPGSKDATLIAAVLDGTSNTVVVGSP
jgi:hypothetical protein